MYLLPECYERPSCRLIFMSQTSTLRTKSHKNTSDSTPTYPLSGSAEMSLELAPKDSGFMTGQYSGQIILTMTAD